MSPISFAQVGSIDGNGVLTSPTSLEFGPDGRLYVAELNGQINAFTVELQDGQFVATDQETLLLPNGLDVVQSIQNHDDDGALNNGETDRQVTGIVVAGTAANPVLYVASSDPRVAQNGEANLDTNSGVVTRVTWTGSEWEAVDIVRGLPRSEENHSPNGLVFDPAANVLYLAVGGNTNNGAPSEFFSYTAEYALSGTVLEIDLTDIESRPILTDSIGGQGGTPRQFVYDLPTLDDPTVANDGVREGADGLDAVDPWGGNDGLNQSILPADAPLRIFADGLRNHYDLALTPSGQLYTVDNGSNEGFGDSPVFVNGEATNQTNDGGDGDPNPFFLIEDGGYYGHPNPVRSNQDLEWIVYDDNGNPDAAVTPNTVPNVSDLVPEGVDIQDGFLIDPSQFTGNPARLAESGVRIERDSPQTNALVTLGVPGNGLDVYTDDAFGGALQGAPIVAQFNGNVTLLNLNDAGDGVEPLVGPGDDGILGTADDATIDSNGIFPLFGGQTLPLDVAVGPDGTIWVADFGANNINVFAPNEPAAAGAVVAAINAGGPTLTQDGINFAADDFFAGGTIFTDGSLGDPVQPAFDGTVFETERFGDPLSYSIPVAPGEYVVELYFAEIFFTTPGARVFDIAVEGQQVFSDVDILAQTAGDINQPIILTVPGNIDPASFGPAGAIDIEFDASVDNAKVNGIVIRATGDPGPNAAPIATNDSFSTAQDTPLDGDVSGNDSDPNGDALTFALGSAASNGTVSFNADGSFTYTPDAGFSGSDSFTYTVSDGELSDTATVNLSVVDASTVVAAINVGGPALTQDGISFGADEFFTGGTVFTDGSFGDPVQTAFDGTIFETERFGGAPGTAPLAYSIPVAPGTYAVELSFAEIFLPGDAVGDRVFDVFVEGALVQDDLDILAETGGDLNQTFILDVPDVDPAASGATDAIDISFSASVDNAKVSGIVIRAAGDAGTNSAPVAADDSFSTDENIVLNGDVSLNDSDPDGDALTFALDSDASNGTVNFNADGSFNYTPDADFSGSDSFTYTVSDGLFASTATVNIAVDPAPEPQDNALLFSLDDSKTLDGENVASQDIVQFEDGDFTLFFDGSDVGLPGNADIDAFAVISETEILLSFDDAFTLPGTGGGGGDDDDDGGGDDDDDNGGGDDDDDDNGLVVDDSDIVLFDATDLGEATEGSFELFFDGSDVGLSSGSEDVDSLALLPDGSLLISTTGDINTAGISRANEDIIQFVPTGLGANTSGSFSVYFDGSDVGLGGENVDAFGFDATGNLFFSVTNDFNVSGVSGQDEDVFTFIPSSLGVVTEGSFASELFFDGSQFGLSSDDLEGLDTTFTPLT